MKLKSILTLILFIGFFIQSSAQLTKDEIILSKIRNEGFGNSKAMEMLSNLTDVYGQRLTGSREYLAAAKWMSQEMKKNAVILAWTIYSIAERDEKLPRK